MLREFAPQHPGVNLRFEFLDSEVASEKVMQGKCELAVVTLPPKIESPLIAQPLWSDPLAFVVGKNHPTDKASLKQLSEMPAILPDAHTFTGRLIQHYFEREGLNLTVSMTTNYLETIKMLCSVDLGWSLLPISMIDNQLKQLNVPGAWISRQLGLIQHTNRTLSNAGKAFVDCLQSQALKN